jgi:hypothetical protein
MLNCIRGLLAEFGHVLPLRAAEVRRRVPPGKFSLRKLLKKLGVAYTSWMNGCNLLL